MVLKSKDVSNQQSQAGNLLSFVNWEAFLHLPHPAYVKDGHGIYLRANSAALEFLHIDQASDLIGKTDRDFLDKDSAEAIMQNDREVFFTKTPIIICEHLKSLDGKQQFDCLSYKFPIQSTNGKVSCVFGVSLKLHEQAKIYSEVPLAEAIMPQLSRGLQHSHFMIKGKKASLREEQCLYYLCRGITAKQIARILNLSPRTVEFYINNSKKKFNCATTAELVAEAVRSRYTSTELAEIPEILEHEEEK
jgi:DNA-binding CsgD family transcriptional regulator